MGFGLDIYEFREVVGVRASVRVSVKVRVRVRVRVRGLRFSPSLLQLVAIGKVRFIQLPTCELSYSGMDCS